MGDFVKVGEIQDFREGRGRAVDLCGVQVAIFRTGDRFIAVSDACRHMGASLADGKLTGDELECGWHGWTYDVRTGQNDAHAWACLAVYEVKLEGQDVLLRRPDPPVPEEPNRDEDDEDERYRDPERFFKRC